MSSRSVPAILSQSLDKSPNHHIQLFKRLDQIVQKTPSFASPSYLAVVYHILAHMEKTFVERRGIDILRFLLTHFSCQSHSFPKNNTCLVKWILHEVAFPFQNKEVLGFFICLQGIYSAIESLAQAFLDQHQGILLIEQSMLPLLQSKSSCTLLYFEVQKKVGNFSPDEIQNLADSLHDFTSALNHTQPAIPSLESSFRMLNYLMEEIEEGDLPHVLIELCSQTSDRLSFFVLLSTTTEVDQTSFSKILSQSNVEEKLRLKKENKEGIVLRVDLNNSLTLSLVEGRNKVSQLIQTVFGDFRDFNGGLLEKIEQNFQALYRLTPKPKERIRAFFDSILPEETRATFPPSALKEIYLASYEAKQDYQFVEQKEWIAAIVKVDRRRKKEWETTLTKALPGVAFSHVDHSNAVILSAFLPTFSEVQKDALEKETQALMNKWLKEQKSLQVLRLCTTSRFTSFDPRTDTEEETSYLHKMLFEGLMRIDKTGKAQHAISERVERFNGGKSYRFFLRKSRWSNGAVLTAYDFLYSWQITLMHKDLAPSNYLFDCIQNAKEIKEGKLPIDALGVKVIHPFTLEVQLLSPCTPFLEVCALSLFSPICQEVDEKYPSWSEAEKDDYVCNGPFCLEKKEPTGSIVLKKNPFYWEKEAVKLDTVTVSMVLREEGKELFLNQQVDALFEYFYKNPDEVPREGLPIKVLKGGINTRYLCFNCSKPPFHNRNVRKAIALALNRPQIATAFSSRAQPAYSFNHHRHSKTPMDIHQAKTLLLKAIADDPDLSQTLFQQKLSVLEPYKDLATFICNHLRKTLSLNWSVSVIEGLATKKNYERKEDFQVTFYSWLNRISDPLYFLGIFSSAQNFSNRSCWTHPLIQSIIKQAAVEETHEGKKHLVNSAYMLLLKEVPMIPLLSIQTESLYQPTIKNLYSSQLQQFDIRAAFKTAK